jgi:hypothetical protein
MLQASLALDLFVRVVVRGDLTESSLTTLAINLWNLAHRHGHIDQKLSVSIYWTYISFQIWKYFTFTVL